MFHCAFITGGSTGVTGPSSSVLLWYIDEPDTIKDWSRYYEGHHGLVSVRVRVGGGVRVM